MIERKQETKLVKQALQKLGINAKVAHERGTGWGWLVINIGSGQQWGEHIIDEYRTHRDCPCCKAMHQLSRIVLDIVLKLTGRTGDYDGRIQVLTQHHWTDKKGNIPIEHNKPKIEELLKAYKIAS